MGDNSNSKQGFDFFQFFIRHFGSTEGKIRAL
jgi:hypothetical protein